MQINKTYLKSLCKVLTVCYMSMTIILKNRHKTDISKFLKIVKFEGLKKLPKKCIKYHIM